MTVDAVEAVRPITQVLPRESRYSPLKENLDMAKLSEAIMGFVADSDQSIMKRDVFRSLRNL